MANRKISDLTALTAPASGDYLPIVDISEAAAADKNKRITVEELLRGAPNGAAGAPGIAFESDPNTGIYSPGADQLAISTNGTERARIDSSGRLLVGISTARSNFFNTSTYSPGLQLEGVTDQNRFVSIVGSNSAGAGGTLILASQKSGGIGGNAIVSNGGQLGVVSFHGNDGTEFVEAARIQVEVDGTPGANDMPGRLVFFTTADGASSPTEQLRITSNRYVRFASGTGGIQFNGDTAAANALDDYEEGTWTPVVYDTGNNNISSSFATNGTGGYYTKIGRAVTITCGLYSGDTTISASIKRIEGLPFTSGANNYTGTPVPFSHYGGSNGDRTDSTATARINNSESQIRVNNSISINQFQTGLYFSATYYV